MYSYITRFDYQAHTHIATTSTSHIQLSHNSNVTQCKICDTMHVVPQCEPNVSPLSDSISRIQATLPIRTRSKPPCMFPIKDQRILRLFPFKDHHLLPCEPTVSP